MEETKCSETSAYKIQTPENYPEESIQQILQVILSCFNLKLQSRSYQILDSTFLHSVQYPHAVVNICGGKSSAFRESVCFFQIGRFSFPTRTVTDLV
jgi:hypothetical protein